MAKNYAITVIRRSLGGSLIHSPRSGREADATWG